MLEQEDYGMGWGVLVLCLKGLAHLLLCPTMQGLSVSPLDFPLCLISPIVSIVMHDTEPRDNLTWASMATLCELGEPVAAEVVRAKNGPETNE